jgi:cell division inhibitor SepF
MMKKLMLYLGLGPDEAYEEYADAPAPGRGPLSSGQFAEARAAADADQRQLHMVPDGRSHVRTVPPEPTGTVRAIQPAVASKPHTVAPVSFNDAQELADRFIAEQPVIVNLQGVESDLSRRIIDFASGLCYGLGGEMEKVANQVYLLTPTDVEVSVEDRRRLEQGDTGD